MFLHHYVLHQKSWCHSIELEVLNDDLFLLFWKISFCFRFNGNFRISARFEPWKEMIKDDSQSKIELFWSSSSSRIVAINLHRSSWKLASFHPCCLLHFSRKNARDKICNLAAAAISHCLKITQNVPLEFFFNFGIFYQFLVLLKVICLITLFYRMLQVSKMWHLSFVILALSINFCPFLKRPVW